MSSTKPGDPKGQATNREAVILCAHGGEAGCGAAEQHAQRLLKSGRFGSVVACCLHGMPNLAMAFDRVQSPIITVVPMLMADGYTCRTVLPAVVTDVAPDGAKVRITPPLGSSPGIGDIIVRQALLACVEKDLQPAGAALVVVGHGTGRDVRSGETVQATVARLRDNGVFGEVRAGFLQQPPMIGDVLADLRAKACVVAGYFADAGGHAQQDLPAQIRAKHREAVYLGPIGVDPEVADVVVELLSSGRDSPRSSLDLNLSDSRR